MRAPTLLLLLKVCILCNILYCTLAGPTGDDPSSPLNPVDPVDPSSPLNPVDPAQILVLPYLCWRWANTRRISCGRVHIDEEVPENSYADVKWILKNDRVGRSLDEQCDPYCNLRNDLFLLLPGVEYHFVYTGDKIAFVPKDVWTEFRNADSLDFTEIAEYETDEPQDVRCFTCLLGQYD